MQASVRSVWVLSVVLLIGCKPRATSQLQSTEAKYDRADLARILVESSIELSIAAYEKDAQNVQFNTLPNIEMVSHLTDTTVRYESGGASALFTASDNFTTYDVYNRPRLVRFIFISFRGTATWTNILNDFNIFSMPRVYVGRVHGGFYNVYYNSAPESLSEKTIIYLHSQLENSPWQAASPENYIVFTGHSLGGALAVMAAAEYCHPRSAIVQHYKAKCLVYTYAAPRTFDSDGATFFNRFMVNRPTDLDVSYLNRLPNMPRYTHYNFHYEGDPVPTGGWQTLPHTGLIHYISPVTPARIVINSVSKHMMSGVYRTAILDYLNNKQGSAYKITPKLSID